MAKFALSTVDTFYSCTKLQSVELPQNLITIPEYTFYGCKALTSIKFSTQLEVIGNYAFHGCSSLSEIELPHGLRTIGTYAFSGCDLFTSVTIPSTVTYINNYAYRNCANLKDVYVKSSTPCEIHVNTFHKDNNLIHVPKGSLDAYLAANYWKYLKFVDDIDEPSGVILPTAAEIRGSNWYTINGSKVTSPKKGQVLINNKKKVIY